MVCRLPDLSRLASLAGVPVSSHQGRADALLTDGPLQMAPEMRDESVYRWRF